MKYFPILFCGKKFLSGGKTSSIGVPENGLSEKSHFSLSKKKSYPEISHWASAFEARASIHLAYGERG